MKTFQQFQEDMSKLPGLGGGGGGTDSITDKSPAKSFKKRVKDVGKILTFPFHKRRKDPTEKFATEGVAALAVGGSKLIPALMTGIGAAGTIMQARKYKTRNNPSGRVGIGKKDKRRIGNMEKEYHKKEQGDRSNDMIVAKQGEAQKQNKLIDKYEKISDEPLAKKMAKTMSDIIKTSKPTSSVKSKPVEPLAKKMAKTMSDIIKTSKPTSSVKSKPVEPLAKRMAKAVERGRPKKGSSPYKKNIRPDILDSINKKISRSKNQFEDAIPTNNVGGGQIAGTVEAGDDPPVKKGRKKKKYIYGGRGSRKMWMNNK